MSSRHAGEPLSTVLEGVVQEHAAARIILSLNPTTGEPIGRVESAGPEAIDAAVDQAASVLKLWHRTSWKERNTHLARLAALIHEQAEDIAQLIAAEQGKPVLEALALEVLPALDHLRFLARHAQRLTSAEGIWPREPLYAHKRSHYLYDSIGVVALITPFNLPFALPLVQIGAALAMGNAVVLKPSELTPLCGDRLGELVIQAGFPEGLVQVIHTEREDGLFLVANGRVDKIFFTGSRETSHQIVAGAGWMPRPVVLSLGGKHPSVVVADADLDRAARGVVWGALANCGQNCGSIERVYVQEAVAARFVERVLAEVDRLRVGNPLSEEVDLGPLSSEMRRQQVHAHVTEAVDAGALRLRGGEIPDGPGFFYPPTVLLNPPLDCRLLQEETLGPVIPIVLVEHLEQGILLANDTDYALTASGWTSSAANADRLMEGLQAGVVTVNDVLYSFGEPASTWSGYKASGMGHNHGKPGLREMSRVKFASYDPAPSEAPVFAYPYDQARNHIVRRVMNALHSSSFAERIGALARLLFSKHFRARVSMRSFLPAWKNRSK